MSLKKKKPQRFFKVVEQSDNISDTVYIRYVPIRFYCGPNPTLRHLILPMQNPDLILFFK